MQNTNHLERRLDQKPERKLRHIARNGLSVIAVDQEVLGRPYWSFMAVEADGNTSAFSAFDFALDFELPVYQNAIPPEFRTALERHGLGVAVLNKLMQSGPVTAIKDIL